MALRKRGQTWWADVTVNGQRYRESLQTTDRREAVSRERALVRRIDEGRLGTASNKSYARLGFSEAGDTYVAGRKGRVAERTTQFEKERLVPLRRYFKNLPLSKITAERIAAYQQARLEEAGVSGRTINMEVSVLGRMLAKAKLWAPLADNVTRFPEATHIGRALEAEEKKRLFRMAGRRPGWMVAHCAAVLAASTTCRGVELRNLRWRDVDLFEKTLRVERSKTESGKRTLPLNQDALLALARLRERAVQLEAAEPEHYVFPWCHGQIDPTRPQKSWRKAWRNLTKAAGLAGFRFHDLRHTAITELAEAGASDATLMALAGHMTRRMIEHYSHVRMEAKRTAVDQLSCGLMGEEPASADSAAVQ
jgi:integrase